MTLINLGLPKESIYKQFVPKNQFYEHGNFNQSEKNVFTNCIKRITLYSQLTRENTNIAEYKDEDKTYKEIAVFLVELRKKDNIDKIAKLVMNSIPYPMILVERYEEEYIFYGANQRDNKLDKTKVILDKIYNTGFINEGSKFIEKINYKNLSKIDLYKFYNDYIKAIINFNLEKRNIGQVKDKEEILSKIEKLEEEMGLLENKMKKENQFNKKMDINMKIKNIEKQLKKMEG